MRLCPYVIAEQKCVDFFSRKAAAAILWVLKLEIVFFRVYTTDNAMKLAR